MSLKSVLNKDGMSRHRADLTVKHNGLQYFTLRLPSGAKLLSALVNDWTIKPVEAGPDEVRLPLPHLQSGGTEDVSLTLIYELKSEAWGAHGSLELPAPAVERTTPVMSSEWRIYVPEGMAVQARGRLVDDADEATAPTLLGAIWRHLTPPKPAATYVYSYDGGPFDNGGGASLLITRSYHIPANKLGPEFSQGHVSALQVLKSLGISFPTGSDASYLPKLGALTVTNTEENLAAIESLLDSFHLSTSPGEAPKAAGIKRRRFLTKETSGNEYPFLYPGVLTPVAGNPQSNGLRAGTAAITPDSINGLIAASANAEKAKAGIITLNVELPVAGRRLDYSGNEKPAALELHYATWETQMHRSLAWALLGALGFAFIGRRRPWLSSLTAALLLTCLPLIWLPAWMVVCNALLAGWLCVLIVWTSWRLARRWESWRQKHRGFATL